MTLELERRWKSGLAPFDGTTILQPEEVPLIDLQPLVAAVVEVLHSSFGNSPIYSLKDWHQHDGYITSAYSATWESLHAITASDAGLQSASTGDTYVRLAFFPAGFEFYLRLYVPDVYDNPRYAHDDPDLVHYAALDITLANSASAVVDALSKILQPLNVTLIAAKPFFDRQYSG